MMSSYTAEKTYILRIKCFKLQLSNRAMKYLSQDIKLFI